MNWIQITATVPAEQSDALEEALMAAGASAVTMEDAQDQPILEPELGTTPLWQLTTSTGLFEANIDLAEAKSLIGRVFNAITAQDPPTLVSEILENEDWTRKWIENFKPIRFGNRLWVCPSWTDIPDPDAVNIMLDPGLAFGTGTHPTTSLCLSWLDSAEIQGKSLVDFGCGSGILGIAALLLGARHVCAIDNDPQAVQATLDNARRNHINKQALDVYLPKDAPSTQADIVVANILAQPLHELKSTIAQLVGSGGQLVMSGILEAQWQSLSDHYQDKFIMSAPEIEDGWVRLHGVKR